MNTFRNTTPLSWTKHHPKKSGRVSNLSLVFVLVATTAGCFPFSTHRFAYAFSVHDRVTIRQANPRTCYFSFPSNKESTISRYFASSKRDDFNTQNPIDASLTWINSDTGSIVLGITGLVLLLISRFMEVEETEFSVERLGAETRTNLLAVMAIGAVLLNGFSKLDVETATAEKVVLDGTDIPEPTFITAAATTETEFNVAAEDVSWVLQSTCAATPANTAVLVSCDPESQWKPIAFVGMVPDNLLLHEPEIPETTPILNRFLQNNDRQESYLPTLQALPGKTELVKFFLPVSTQAALLVPVDRTTVLLLGSNQARSFTPRDIIWIQSVAARLRTDR